MKLISSSNISPSQAVFLSLEKCPEISACLSIIKILRESTLLRHATENTIATIFENINNSPNIKELVDTFTRTYLVILFKVNRDL